MAEDRLQLRCASVARSPAGGEASSQGMGPNLFTGDANSLRVLAEPFGELGPIQLAALIPPYP